MTKYEDVCVQLEEGESLKEAAKRYMKENYPNKSFYMWEDRPPDFEVEIEGASFTISVVS